MIRDLFATPELQSDFSKTTGLNFEKEFYMVDEDRRFRVPTVFVTNAGNSMRKKKAQQLSEWLQVPVRGVG